MTDLYRLELNEPCVYSEIFENTLIINHTMGQTEQFRYTHTRTYEEL